MRLALSLITALALFWQTVFALPIASNELAAVIDTAYTHHHHQPRTPNTINTIPLVSVSRIPTKRGWASLAKPAKKLWSKVTGKNKNDIKMPPKFKQAVKADIAKWRPHVEAQRKKNQG